MSAKRLGQREGGTETYPANVDPSAAVPVRVAVSQFGHRQECVQAGVLCQGVRHNLQRLRHHSLSGISIQLSTLGSDPYLCVRVDALALDAGDGLRVLRQLLRHLGLRRSAASDHMPAHNSRLKAQLQSLVSCSSPFFHERTNHTERVVQRPIGFTQRLEHVQRALLVEPRTQLVSVAIQPTSSLDARQSTVTVLPRFFTPVTLTSLCPDQILGVS